MEAPIYQSTGSTTSALSSVDSNEDIEDRMKRWAERKEEKRRMKAQKHIPKVSGATVEEVLSKKGLPLASLVLIGSGSFAEVYKGVWTKESHGCKANSVVAVKVMKMKESRSGASQGDPPKWLQREVNISSVQHHEHLIQVIGAFVDSLPYAIVFEYCAGGSLDEVVSGDPETTLGRFCWEHRLKASLDVAEGMQYLHKKGIVHRDLKSQNVLLAHPVLTANDVVHAKVCDFGLARFLPGEDHQTVLTVQVGSYYYMAPEMFMSFISETAEDCAYDEKVDVYSYGMMIYYMLAGKFAFPGERMNYAEFVIFASDGGRPREDAIPAAAPEVLRIMMKESWGALPLSRPAFSKIADRLRGSQAGNQNSMRGVFASWLCCVGR